MKVLLHACMPSCFSRVRLFVTSWTVARQAPLSMGFFGQEYWSELPFPTVLLQGFFPTQGSSLHLLYLLHLQAGSSEKAIAPHSSALACKVAWTEEPAGLRSVGSRRVGQD